MISDRWMIKVVSIVNLDKNDIILLIMDHFISCEKNCS